VPQGGGMRGCKELREASMVTWWAKGLSTTDLATLWARYGSVLPALRLVSLLDNAGATAGHDMACSGWRRGWARARSPSRDLPPPHSLQFSIRLQTPPVIYKYKELSSPKYRKYILRRSAACRKALKKRPRGARHAPLDGAA
jgi:hypothetical protein